MLSKQQKTTISTTQMRRKPRYVRVPVQMSNRVRDLKTDVNFSQLAARFEVSIAQLQELATGDPVFHIQFDQTTNRDWYSIYCKLCDAFRSLNNSRVIRRMRISGFRMLNVSTHLNGYKMVSDTYVASLDCASVMLDSIVRFMMPAGRLTVLIDCRGSRRDMSILRSQIASSEYWNQQNWRITLREDGRLYLTAPRETVVEAVNLAASLAGQRLRSIDFRFMNLRVDIDVSPDLMTRYGAADIAVMLSGYRYRTFQKFGQLTKIYTQS